MIAGKVSVKLNPSDKVIKRLGLDARGDVQLKFTNIVNHRITRYMPYRTGVLSTKSKHIKSPTEIEVVGPYARYQYYGKAMEGKPPKTVTDRDLEYTKPGSNSLKGNALAGPYWEKRMMAAEGAQVVAELQDYINRRAK